MGQTDYSDSPVYVIQSKPNRSYDCIRVADLSESKLNELLMYLNDKGFKWFTGKELMEFKPFNVSWLFLKDKLVTYE